jgi:hypothetical protein
MIARSGAAGKGFATELRAKARPIDALKLWRLLAP